jgi:hypothetical protein
MYVQTSLFRAALTKTITIRDEVYRKLLTVKRRDESFSKLFEILTEDHLYLKLAVQRVSEDLLFPHPKWATSGGSVDRADRGQEAQSHASKSAEEKPRNNLWNKA